MNRRQFLTAAAAGGAMQLLASRAAEQSNHAKRAILFDAFPIFDPRPVSSLATELVPEKGSEFLALWRIRQFEYTWLRTMMGRYVDFPTATRDALEFAAKSLKLTLSAATRQRLLESYFHLKAWPDVLPALRSLKQSGIKLGFLSNFSREMLHANIRNAGLDEFFEPILSTDRVKAFKPDPRAYQMGVDALGLPRTEIIFAAFAGWDVAGAKSFGYRTFWVNRQNSAEEELQAPADEVGSLEDLVKFATL